MNKDDNDSNLRVNDRRPHLSAEPSMVSPGPEAAPFTWSDVRVERDCERSINSEYTLTLVHEPTGRTVHRTLVDGRTEHIVIKEMAAELEELLSLQQHPSPNLEEDSDEAGSKAEPASSVNSGFDLIVAGPEAPTPSQLLVFRRLVDGGTPPALTKAAFAEGARHRSGPYTRLEATKVQSELKAIGFVVEIEPR